MSSQPTTNIWLQQWLLWSRHLLSILKQMVLGRSLSPESGQVGIMRKSNSELIHSIFINQLVSKQEVGL